MDTHTNHSDRRPAVRRPTRSGIRSGRNNSTARTNRPTRPGPFSVLGALLFVGAILLGFFGNPMAAVGAQTFNGTPAPADSTAPSSVTPASDGSDAPTLKVDPATGTPLPVGYVIQDDATSDGPKTTETTEPQGPTLLPCNVETVNNPWNEDPGVMTVQSSDNCLPRTFTWSVNSIGRSFEDQHELGRVTVTVPAGGQATLSIDVPTPLCVQTDRFDEKGEIDTDVIRQPAQYGDSNFNGTLPTPDQCVPATDLTTTGVSTPAAPPVTITHVDNPAIPETPTTWTEADQPPVAQPPVAPPTNQVSYTCEQLQATGKALACTGASNVLFSLPGGAMVNMHILGLVLFGLALPFIGWLLRRSARTPRLTT